MNNYIKIDKTTSSSIHNTVTETQLYMNPPMQAANKRYQEFKSNMNRNLVVTGGAQGIGRAVCE